MRRTPPPQESRQKRVHLYRGAPCVRSWSKYKATDRAWSLCGIPNHKTRAFDGTEDGLLVTCEFCRDLAGLKSTMLAAPSCRINRKAAGGVKIPLMAENAQHGKCLAV